MMYMYEYYIDNYSNWKVLKYTQTIKFNKFNDIVLKGSYNDRFGRLLFT